MELKEEDLIFSNEEIDAIKEVSEDIYEEFGSTSSKLITKNLVFEIYLALLISIPGENIFLWIKEIDIKGKDKILQNLYDDYLSIKKENFSSRILQKKVQGKYDYYEQAYRKRAKIQNYEFNYHNLANSTSNFIQAREIIKIENKFLKRNKPGPICCKVCGIKWLTSETDACPTCEKANDISMFVTLCNYFNVLGDMEQFFNALHPQTYEYILDNWNEIKNFFKQKSIKKRQDKWNKLVSKYGSQQYKKIIKPDGGDWGLNDDIKEFNAKYNLALITGTLDIDMRNAKNALLPEFISDFNSIKWPFADKLRLPERAIDINNIRPQARFIKEIWACNCKIKTISLDPQYFPNLKIINLENNIIENYDDIKALEKIKSLKVINVLNNPIEANKEIFNAERKLRDDIELRYNPNLKYSTQARIDAEQDPEVKKIMEQNLDFDESEQESKSEIIPKRQRQMKFPSDDEQSK